MWLDIAPTQPQKEIQIQSARYTWPNIVFCDFSSATSWSSWAIHSIFLILKHFNHEEDDGGDIDIDNDKGSDIDIDNDNDNDNGGDIDMHANMRHNANISLLGLYVYI